MVMKQWKYVLAGALACLVVMPTVAAAQVEDQTGIADPGRLQDRLIDEVTPTPQISPRVQVQETQLLGVPPGAENINLTLRSVTFDGVSVYSQSTLERLYADKLGQVITLADVYGIANDVVLKYRNDGYVLAQVVIPPQTIDDGNVRIQVVEGFIDNIIIQAPEGESGDAVNLIRKYAARMGEADAIHINQLERGLLLINDLPGIEARSILSPSPTTPGAAELLIIVSRDAFDALVFIDNYGSRFLGPVQMGTSATYNGLFSYNDSITATLVGAPDDGWELAFGSLRYAIPVWKYGTVLSFMGSQTRTDPGFTLKQFDVNGYSSLYSVRMDHPFIRSRNTNLRAHLQFDWRDVKSTNNIVATNEDNLRIARGGMEFDFVDRIFGAGINTLGIEVSQGLGIFGASDKGDANLTRAQADPNATKVNIEIERTQRISSKFNLLMQGSGQLASDPLLSSEEFAIGGVNTVRGFDPSEVSGDDGIAGRLELQWNNPGETKPDFITNYQVYTYFDAGRVWDQDATDSTTKRETLTGAGLGVRADFMEDFSGGIGLAFPLNRDVQTQRDDDPKLYMNFSKRF